MTRFIDCAKLKENKEALDRQPYPGELGKKIYETISKDAWQMWLSHQTMLINEYRLSMQDTKAREFLVQEMENFLFGTGSHRPSGYVPPE